MASDRQFTVSGRWALSSDGVQWMVQRRRLRNGQDVWDSLSFVHSTKEILARCLQEKGCPVEDAQRLLTGLPETFNKWQEARVGNAVHREISHLLCPVASSHE
jgi:hypothetical protein